MESSGLLVIQYNPMHTLKKDAFLKKMNVHVNTGYSRDEALKQRSLHGVNRVQPPIQCPSWICCLLPCLLRTRKMQLYNEYLSKEVTVRRSNRILRMDTVSLVVGDVVYLKPGDLVPADLRIVECSNDLVVNFSSLVIHSSCETSHEGTVESTCDTEPLKSCNMLFMSSFIMEGECTAIVVATGEKTVWGNLLAVGKWPLYDKIEKLPLIIQSSS